MKISPKGASPGDLVFVVGYPGGTERHQTYAQIADQTSWQLPRSIRRSTEQLPILTDLAHQSPELAIKVESRIRGLNNGLTKNKGVLEGLVAGGALDRKLALQKELAAWIAAEPKRTKEYGDVLPSLAALDEEAAKTRERDAAFAGLRGGGGGSSSFFGTADTIVQAAVNRAKPDIDREPEYQERNWTRTKESFERAQRTMDKTVDRALLRYQLVEISRLSAGRADRALDRAVGLRRTWLRCRREIDRRLPGQALRGNEASRQGLPDRPSRQVVEGDRGSAGPVPRFRLRAASVPGAAPRDAARRVRAPATGWSPAT